MKITLKSKDIKKTYSGTGTIIDELAYASGQWTENELHNNNYDYQYDGNDYVIKHFDFEDALLQATRTDKKLYDLARKLEVSLNANWEKIAKKQKLQSGACVALNNEEQWNELLARYKDTCIEDSEFLSKYAQELKKELQEAENSFWNNLTHEWLYGDYRDFNGILYEIKKYWDAEDIIFNDKNWDEVTLVFDDEKVKEEMDKPTIKNYKGYLLTIIKSACESRHNKEMAEREKRIAERKAIEDYKAERKAQADAERKAKILALTK